MELPHADLRRGSSGAHGPRGCAVLLAGIAVALILGVVAPSAAGPSPSFAAPRHYATGEDPETLAIGDLNEDGKPDVATANYDPQTVSVLLNGGAGILRAPATTTRPGPVRGPSRSAT